MAQRYAATVRNTELLYSRVLWTVVQMYKGSRNDTVWNNVRCIARGVECMLPHTCWLRCCRTYCGNFMLSRKPGRPASTFPRALTTVSKPSAHMTRRHLMTVVVGSLCTVDAMPPFMRPLACAINGDVPTMPLKDPFRDDGGRCASCCGWHPGLQCDPVLRPQPRRAKAQEGHTGRTTDLHHRYDKRHRGWDSPVAALSGSENDLQPISKWRSAWQP